MTSALGKNIDQKLVSIIMPTFQHGHCIDKSINSVINQTYQNWELLVIDNYSQDNTEDVLKQYDDPRVIYYKYLNNGVIAASRNFGISQSKGSWLAFLDSDDWWSSRKLEKSLHNAFLNEADIVFHDLYLVKNENQKFFVSKARGRKIKEKIFDDLLTYGNALLNSSVVVRKEILIKVGGISEDLDKISWEDYDCWLRISQITNKFLYINEALGFYWVGGGNTSTPSTVLKNTASIEVNYKNYFQNPACKPFWLGNGRGKAFLDTRMYNQAIKEFKSIDRNTIKSIDWLKVKYRMIQIYFIKMKEKFFYK